MLLPVEAEWEDLMKNMWFHCLGQKVRLVYLGEFLGNCLGTDLLSQLL